MNLLKKKNWNIDSIQSRGLVIKEMVVNFVLLFSTLVYGLKVNMAQNN